jgi:DNA-binding response OmpR family regulator
MSQILIAANSPKIYQPLVQGLRKNGFETLAVQCGAEAVSHSMQSKFDLAIVDSDLPDQSGWQVLQKIYQAQTHTLSIMLVEANYMYPQDHPVYTQASDIIFKPFRLEELLLRVQMCLQKANQSKNFETQTLRSGNITLDAVFQQVWKDNVCVDLSTKEFVLLSFLMSEAGKVVTRKDLLQKVWGYEHDNQSNVVDVYIAYLRKKLGSQLIRTVRGKGYQFSP